MKLILNRSQKESLSDFFNSIAVAWFVALFATPAFNLGNYTLLTLLVYGVTILAALGVRRSTLF